MRKSFLLKFGLIFCWIVLFEERAASNSYIHLPDRFVQEEISIGSLIMDIAEEVNKHSESAGLVAGESEASTDESQHFTFLEDARSSTESGYFLLDPITGRVTSKRYLDRESMCVNKHCLDACDNTPAGSCKMNLKVLLIPSYNIASVNIIIQDINDNKPQFRVESMNQSIPENVPIGYKLPIDLAYDPDSGINSIQLYSLQLTSLNPAIPAEFYKDTFQLMQNPNELALVVRRKLDRERIAQYNLTISACDGGTPNNCGKLKLILSISDINDHNPTFLKESYSFTAGENLPVGSVVGKVTAYDLDEDLNGKVKYSMVDGQRRNNFAIDEESGEIRLVSELDFETERHFSLTVEARDCGVGSLPAYASVEVKVLDENDNAPEISSSFLNSLKRDDSNQIFMAENSQGSQFIAHVSISDRDSGVNGQVEWRVVVNGEEARLNNDENQLLSINKLNSNSLTVSSGPKAHILFDRETLPSVNVSILAWDLGQPQNSASFNFSLILTDENDNPPKFNQDSYEIIVTENNQIKQVLYEFGAVDLDLGENARVTYSLRFGADVAEPFVEIDANSGVLRASKIFDAEEKNSYEFILTGSDGKFSASVNCILRILDQNDNRPKLTYQIGSAEVIKEAFDQTSLTLKIDENIPINTNLVKFTCIDVDQLENGKTRIQLVHKNNNFDQTLPFQLSNDGVLTSQQRLDRESKEVYEMLITCWDEGRFALNTSQKLIIKLDDVNDNCPRNVDSNTESKIKFFTKSSLAREVRNKTSLMSASYADSDAGKNAELKFELETHANIFKLEPIFNQHIYTLNINFNANNKSSLGKLIDLLRPGKYVVRVRVSDNGYPSCSKSDSFVFYLGNGEMRSQNELVEKLKISDGNEDFVNDEDEPGKVIDESLNETLGLLQHKMEMKYSSFETLSKNDLFVFLFLIGTLAAIAVLLVTAVALFLCRRKRGEKPRDLLKVKNYRGQVELDESRASSQSSENQCEMNNLLDDETAHLNHRLSLSSKSTDQSQSADSVATYARTTSADTTTITNSSSSATNSQIHLHAASYSPNDSAIQFGVNQRNSTFLGFKQSHIETNQALPGYVSIVPYARSDFQDDNYQLAASNPASVKSQNRKSLDPAQTFTPNYLKPSTNTMNKSNTLQKAPKLDERNPLLLSSFNHHRLSNMHPTYQDFNANRQPASMTTSSSSYAPNKMSNFTASASTTSTNSTASTHITTTTPSSSDCDMINVASNQLVLNISSPSSASSTDCTDANFSLIPKFNQKTFATHNEPIFLLSNNNNKRSDSTAKTHFLRSSAV